MKVWIVFAPQDYSSADIIGVYSQKADAEKARKNTISERRKLDTVLVQEHCVYEGPRRA